MMIEIQEENLAYNITAGRLTREEAIYVADAVKFAMNHGGELHYGMRGAVILLEASADRRVPPSGLY